MYLDTGYTTTSWVKLHRRDSSHHDSNPFSLHCTHDDILRLPFLRVGNCENIAGGQEAQRWLCRRYLLSTYSVYHTPSDILPQSPDSHAPTRHPAGRGRVARRKARGGMSARMGIGKGCVRWSSFVVWGLERGGAVGPRAARDFAMTGFGSWVLRFDTWSGPWC